MTIKEIANTAGCNEQTVRRIVNDKMPGKIQNGKVTRFTWDEAHTLMALLPKRNLVQMPEVPLTNVQGSALDSRTLEIIAATVASLASTLFEARLQKLENRIESRQALLPAPKVSDKDSIRELANKEAVRSNREHSKVWNELYDRCYYLHMGNLKLQATNAKAKSVLDHIDKIGLSSEVLAVALDLWGPRA